METHVRLHLENIDIQEWIQNGRGKNGAGRVDLYVQAIHNHENLIVYPTDQLNDVNLF